MELDLLDYVLGFLKVVFYKIIYLNRVNINVYTKFSYHAAIRVYKRGLIKFGKNTTSRAGVKFRVGKNAQLIIGDRTGFNNGCCINCLHNITIGENVIVGQNVMIYDHDHIYKDDGIIRDKGFNVAPIQIGNNVWIGSGCIILKGVSIGDGVVVAAGTIVNKNIPDNCLVYNERKIVHKNIK